MNETDTARERDTERFVRLLTESQREIRRYIQALVPDVDDAQEILQETAVALWRKFDGYDPDRPFVAWACRFAFRHVLKYRKLKTRRSRYLSVEVLEQLAEERIEQNDILESRRLALARCLKRLSDADRSLIEQRYARRANLTRTAEATGRNMSTIYKALERVRRRLLECVNRSLKLEGLL